MSRDIVLSLLDEEGDAKELLPLLVALLFGSAEVSDVVDDEGAMKGAATDKGTGMEAGAEVAAVEGGGAGVGAGVEGGLPPYRGEALKSSAAPDDAVIVKSSTVWISAKMFFKCLLLPFALALRAAARDSLRCESWSSKPYRS